MLDLDTLDSEFARIVASADGKTSVASQLAKAYDDYAKGGVILGADLSAGGDKSLLESAFTVCEPSSGTVSLLEYVATFAKPARVMRPS